VESKAVVPLKVDADGKVRHDVLLHQGKDKDKIIHANYNALVAVDVTQDSDRRTLPSEEEIKAQAEKTWGALTGLIDGKVAAAQQKHVEKPNTEPVFIRYTPAQQGAAFNSGASQRVIRMVEAKVWKKYWFLSNFIGYDVLSS
jgi:SNW domain-containing protein 1